MSKYFIVRQNCCDEGKTWSRTFIADDKKGYPTLEEAQKVLTKTIELEKIDIRSDAYKEALIATLEEREPKEDDGWHHKYSIVALVDCSSLYSTVV